MSSPEQEVKKDTLNQENRSVVDLAGDTVIIPSADEIDRVLLMGPPLLATYMSTVKDPSKLVGVHPNSFKQANSKLLDIIFPNWQEVSTAFLTGAEANVEEILKLDPDVIFVYGKGNGQGHKRAVERLDIPVVDFASNQDTENELIGSARLMREIFDIKADGFIAKEWEKANKKVDEVLNKTGNSSVQEGLIIGVNSGNEISIRGPGAFGHVVLTKSGLVDVTEELNTHVAGVSMEQIYTWNPDIIYLFKGIPAEKYLSNSIKNQDWSKVEAFKTKRIYDVPKGMMHWGSPNPDSPLMVQWMLSKNYPDQFSEEEFKTVMRTYYEDNYGIELTEELMNSILYPNSQK